MADIAANYDKGQQQRQVRKLTDKRKTESKKFGEELKKLMHLAGLKERELANFINYDITSISKWVNGAKLPSKRNRSEIIYTLAECFAQNIKDVGADAAEIAEELLNACRKDELFKEMEIQGTHSLSFVDSRKDFFDVLEKLFRQVSALDDHTVEIAASFNVLEHLGHRFYELIQKLPSAGTKRFSMKMCMNMPEQEVENKLYCDMLLNIVAGYERAEISIVAAKEQTPWIIVVNGFFYIQILYQKEDDFAACFSTDPEVASMFRRIGREIFENAEQVLSYASPENLRKTNVQLDSYSCRRQRLFFNEAPAMLLPENVMEELAKQSENKDYSDYLRKLKKVFSSYTYNARVDLLLFSSVISEYIATGELSLGNVPHHLTEKQVKDHINYISRCMEENHGFKVYVLRDTVNESENLRMFPSIFIDTMAVTLENSRRKPNENYHISMYPQIIRVFEKYFDAMIQRPDCYELTPEEMRRYL